MFSVGQRVWHRGSQRSGSVLECDGNRVFIEQDNGAELEFPATDLTATPPAATKPSGRELTAAPHRVPSRTLKPADITPEHMRVLGILPVRMLQAVAAVFERRSKAARFGSLDAAAKLNFITEITAVPYRTMREYSDRPGELGLLMGKGLADSRKAG